MARLGRVEASFILLSLLQVGFQPTDVATRQSRSKLNSALAASSVHVASAIVIAATIVAATVVTTAVVGSATIVTSTTLVITPLAIWRGVGGEAVVTIRGIRGR